MPESGHLHHKRPPLYILGLKFDRNHLQTPSNLGAKVWVLQAFGLGFRFSRLGRAIVGV